MDIVVTRRFCEAHRKPCIFVRADNVPNELVDALNFHHGHYVHRAYLSGEYHFSAFMKNIFINHKYFYQLLREDYQEYHPNDAEFDGTCMGFISFLSKNYGVASMLDAQFAPVLSELIGTALSKCLDNYTDTSYVTIQSTCTLDFPSAADTRTQSMNLAIPQILNGAIILTDTSAFSIKLQKLKHKSLQDIEIGICKALQQSYESQIKAKTAAQQEQIATLQRRIETVKFESFTEGIKTYELLRKDGWKFNNGYLIYPKRIYAEYVKHKNVIFEIPEKYRRTFYVEKLKVPVASIVSKAYCRRAKHLNVNSTEICLGDLKGQQLLDVVRKLPAELKTLNRDSPFENEAKRLCDEILETSEDHDETEGGGIWQT